MPIKQIVKETMVLVLAAVLLALVVNGLSPAGLPLLPPPQGLSSPPKDSFEIITAAAVKDMLDSDRVILADARAKDQYQQGHIPGAVSLPAYNLDPVIFPFLDTYPPEITVIIYCSSPHCSDSQVLAEELRSAGYRDVGIFAGGMAAWKKKGYAVESHE